MSGSCKSKTPSGLSDVLRSRVEIDPRDIWKVLVKHVIAHKGHDIKKGHTNAWYTVLINVSTWVESRLCEEGMELTVCHRKSKWTIDTIDEVLVDYVDQDIGYHIPHHLVVITRKKVEIEQGGLCAGCGLHKHMQLDHVNETPRDWRLSNLQFLCSGCHRKVPNMSVSLYLTCAFLTSTYRKRSSTRLYHVSFCRLTLLFLSLQVASF